jgi:ABC-type multidrug transport system ATPase subunit
LRREPKKVRERIGYVGQRNGSDPGLTARQELLGE